MADATKTVEVVALFWSWQAAVPPMFGLLSGFQAIHGKFPATPGRALAQVGSIFYMLTRGSIPFAGYWLWFNQQEPPNHSLMAAAAWGLGTEVLLRSQLYLGQKQSPDGTPEPVFKGIFDLVEWYQNMWLNGVGNRLAKRRNKFVNDLVGQASDFPAIAARARNRANGWPNDQKDRILKKIAEIEAIAAANGGAANHLDLAQSLAFAFLDLVGEEGTHELFT